MYYYVTQVKTSIGVFRRTAVFSSPVPMQTGMRHSIFGGTYWTYPTTRQVVLAHAERMDDPTWLYLEFRYETKGEYLGEDVNGRHVFTERVALIPNRHQRKHMQALANYCKANNIHSLRTL